MKKRCATCDIEKHIALFARYKGKKGPDCLNCFATKRRTWRRKCQGVPTPNYRELVKWRRTGIPNLEALE